MNSVINKFVTRCNSHFGVVTHHGTLKALRSPAIEVCGNVFSPAVPEFTWAKHTPAHKGSHARTTAEHQLWVASTGQAPGTRAWA